MNITLEAIEKVMDLTGVEYKAAKAALEKTNGNVDEAVKLIQPKSCEAGDDINKLIDKLKKIVEDGNVDKIQIRKDDEIILSVPVNVGLVGGLVGLATAPWALIGGTIAAFGLGCKLLVVKKDGTTDVIR